MTPRPRRFSLHLPHLNKFPIIYLYKWDMILKLAIKTVWWPTTCFCTPVQKVLTSKNDRFVPLIKIISAEQCYNSVCKKKKQPTTCTAPVFQSQVDRTGTGPKERNENIWLCWNAAIKEQEFKFLALSPENESLRLYRQHTGMADSYVLCVERGMTSSPCLWTTFP